MPGRAILACPECGNADNVAGIEIRGVYDGVLFWECWECGQRWNSWPQDHPRWAVAQEFMTGEPGQVRRKGGGDV